MTDPNVILRQAFAQHQAGALESACALYHDVLVLRPADPDALHLSGVACAALGDPARGIALIRRAIASQPRFTSAHYNIGTLLLGQGQPEAALHNLDACLAQSPDHAGALAASGRALLMLGRPQDAVAFLHRAVQQTPDPFLWNDLGTALGRSGHPDEALQACEQAIRLWPTYPEAHFNRGCLLLARPDLAAAAVCFEAVLAIQSEHRQALWNLALTRIAQAQPASALAALDRLLVLEPLHLMARRQRAAIYSDLDRRDDAVADLTVILTVTPDDADVLVARAIALRILDRLDEAVQDLEQALALVPNHVDALVERANVAQDQADHETALALYARALTLRPNHLAALVNRGAALRAMGYPAQALRSWRQALAVQPDHPDIMLNIAFSLLQRGQWPEGWQAHEARLRRPPWTEALEAFTAPQWDGQADLAGRRLLLVSEQGLGDTIQFSRFARLVAARGATVLLGVEPSLRRLLTGLAGVADVICPEDPPPTYDLFCPLMSLPAKLGLTLANAAMVAPYLSADPTSLAAWRARLASLPGRKIGLVWSGNPRLRDRDAPRLDQRRSIPFDCLLPLLQVPNITFVSLQKGPASTQAAGRPIQDWTAELHDFADTAALIEALDLVITVDTSVAHAAGALGRPVWVLNRFDRCWRWMVDRADTPWYPTMRLFTQTRPGGWDGVVHNVIAALVEADAASRMTPRRTRAR